VFSGILLDTVKGVYDVDEEQRAYVLQRLIDIVGQQQCATKILESVNGSLGWLCYVIYHGRCRRDILQRACDSGDATTQITKALRQQLRWWSSPAGLQKLQPQPRRLRRL
jgi:GH24 family phage-related lysozyme (muramidase)